MKRFNKNKQSGFTLVEIAIAVAILGLAFTTLVSLHTKMLNAYSVEKNRNIAAMVGQYMIAMIEVAPTPPQIGSDSGQLKSILQDYGYFDTDDQNSHFDKDIKGWEYRTTVTSGDLADLKDVYRKIDLNISWGNGEEDSFDFVYFVFTRSYTGGSGGGIGGASGIDQNNPYNTSTNASSTASGSSFSQNNNQNSNSQQDDE